MREVVSQDRVQFGLKARTMTILLKLLSSKLRAIARARSISLVCGKTSRKLPLPCPNCNATVSHLQTAKAEKCRKLAKERNAPWATRKLQKMASFKESMLASNNAPLRLASLLQTHACAMCWKRTELPLRVRRAEPTGKQLNASSCFQSDSTLGRFFKGKLPGHLR